LHKKIYNAKNINNYKNDCPAVCGIVEKIMVRCVGARIARPRNQRQCNVFARATEGGTIFNSALADFPRTTEGGRPYIIIKIIIYYGTFLILQRLIYIKQQILI